MTQATNSSAHILGECMVCTHIVADDLSLGRPGQRFDNGTCLCECCEWDAYRRQEPQGNEEAGLPVEGW